MLAILAASALVALSPTSAQETPAPGEVCSPSDPAVPADRHMARLVAPANGTTVHGIATVHITMLRGPQARANPEEVVTELHARLGGYKFLLATHRGNSDWSYRWDTVATADGLYHIWATTREPLSPTQKDLPSGVASGARCVHVDNGLPVSFTYVSSGVRDVPVTVNATAPLASFAAGTAAKPFETVRITHAIDGRAVHTATVPTNLEPMAEDGSFPFQFGPEPLHRFDLPVGDHWLTTELVFGPGQPDAHVFRGPPVMFRVSLPFTGGTEAPSQRPDDGLQPDVLTVQVHPNGIAFDAAWGEVGRPTAVYVMSLNPTPAGQDRHVALAVLGPDGSTVHA
ncbi:MAG TPA: hypothetical protein VHI93_02570, partial [Candidatus Thermoplasmatota archaeon]|nr:hypothetical protein [Candidatus Thermoplasmatota archaeon]